MRKILIAIIVVLALLAGFAAYHFQKSKSDSSIESASYGGDFDDVSYFADLRSEVLVMQDQDELDVDALISLMPDIIRVVYGGVEFDENSGATIIQDIKFTSSTDEELGVQIDQLKFWGVDSAAISAKLSGSRLDETLKIAKRVEAKNLSVIGLEKAFAPMMDASNALTAGMVENAINGDHEVAIPTQTLDTYNFRISDIVLTDLTAHPWVLDLKPLPGKDTSETDGLNVGNNEMSGEEFWHWIQTMAAWNHVVSFSNLAAFDGKYELSFTQGETSTKMSMDMGMFGYKDYYRGDIGLAVMRDTSYDMDLVVPSLAPNDGSTDFQTMTMQGAYGSYIIEEWKLARVMEHLALGIMPDRSNTDFMSLGIWRAANSVSKIDGNIIYSVDSFYMDMSDFHWLLPETIDIRATNIKYNIAGLMSYMEQASSGLVQTDEAATEAERETMAKVVEILGKYDLAAPSLDFQMAGHWNAETGKSDLLYAFGIDKLMDVSYSAAGTLPDYAEFLPYIPEDWTDIEAGSFDTEGFAQLFEDQLSFSHFKTVFADKGGLEKGFAMAIDFAQLAPEDDPSAAFLKNADARQLRSTAAGSVLMGAGEASKSFPPAVDYLQSLSKFIGEGGTFTVELKPATPLGYNEFEKLPELMQDDPDKVVETLGLRVVHDPAIAK